MKRAPFLALIAAILTGVCAVAQESNEVVYVHDATQGYLFNRFKDNWFMTVEGGAGIYMSEFDGERKLMDRWAPGAGLYVGKWFSPIIALRLGIDWMDEKALSQEPQYGNLIGEPTVNGYYKQKFNEIGLAFDAMINLTNWWCGYRTGRVYNAMVYAGVGAYESFVRDYSKSDKGKWANGKDNIVAGRVGLINSFNLSRQVALSIDLRWTFMEAHQEAPVCNHKTAHNLQANLGLTYLFNKRMWSTPLVPVCPPPENCDALRARLEAAESRITDLESQLQACLARPTEVVAEKVEKGPLATIYYPINVYSLSRRDINVLGAIANVMKANPEKHYVLTGWADNYTGTEQFNVKLRHNRVNGVEKQLVRLGVPKSQLTVTINNGNLCDMGEKFVALDRAVTISEGE